MLFNLIGKSMAKREKVNLNRLRIVLAEKNKTNRWLAEQLGVTEGTVSKWATNTHQPTLETLYQISVLFKIDIHDLIESTLPKK
ncbi:helix-turn-helix domain protein [Niastella koreensis GR20-10]|uniref:Helix-turn-helix domain protein n=2 Tax=Niastella koreensis TaxID=354356 RepID=G8TG55_NIAKG|nr:helix-turn-helix domain protein [Niastella koreensis GR20-10]